MDLDKHLPSMLAWGGSALTGVFTLLGVWIANKSSLKQLKLKLDHETEKDQKEALRQRLEELYSLIGRWAGEVVIHHTTYRRVMDGQISYNDALDLQIKHKSQIDANRMFTLAELYFPDAHEALQELKELRDRAAQVQSSFKEQYRRNGEPSTEHSKLLTKVLERFDVAIQKYQSALSAYANDV